MKCYSLVIEPTLVKEIDSLIKKHGLYSSRSDFIRDAIRQRLIEIKKVVVEEPEKEKEPDKKEVEEQEEFVEEALEEFRHKAVH